MIEGSDAILDVPRFLRIGRKFEIGICPLFQIYEPTSLFFELANSTSEWVIYFAPPAPTRYKGPFPITPIVDYKKVFQVINLAHRYRDSLVPLSRIVHPLLMFGEQKNR